ncbi:hypothetical protein D3C80_763510 [compost metagenome]
MHHLELVAVEGVGEAAGGAGGLPQGQADGARLRGVAVAGHHHLIALQGPGKHIAVRAGVEGLDVPPAQGRTLAAQLDQAAVVIVQHMIPVCGVPGEAATAVRIVAAGEPHLVAVVDGGHAYIGDEQGGGEPHALLVLPQQVEEAGGVVAVQQVELGQLVLERDMSPGQLEPAVQLLGADPDGVIGDVLPRQEGADGVGEAVVVHGAVLLIPLQPLARLEEVFAEHVGVRVLLLHGAANGAHMAAVAHGRAPLPQHVDDVEAPAIDLVGGTHPIAQNGVVCPIHGVLHLLAGEVQLGQAANALPADIIPLLIEGVEAAPGGVRVALGPQRRAEPGVVGGGVVDHGVQDDLHAALMQVAGQLGKLGIGAEVRVDAVVILGVVLVVARRIEDGVEVERRHPQGLQVVQLGVYPRQIPAVELAGAVALLVAADRFPPGLADDRLAAVLVLVMLDAQRRIAVAEAVGEDLVEDLILYPGRRLVMAVEAEMLLPRRHGGADARPVQPPLLLVGEALEAVEVDLLPPGQRQLDLPDLQPVPGRDRAHGHQVLLVVRLVTQPHLADGGVQLAEQGEQQGIGTLFEPGCHLGMKQEGMGHGIYCIRGWPEATGSGGRRGHCPARGVAPADPPGWRDPARAGRPAAWGSAL